MNNLHKQPNSILRPILIYRLGSLGDTVVALPCFHLIRRVYPNRRIVLLTNEPVSGNAAPAMDVLAGSGLCDEAIAYPTKLRNVRRLSALRQKIQSYQFEAAFHLCTTRGWLRGWRDYLFFYACGIRCIIGTSFQRRVHITQAPAEQECTGLIRRIQQIGNIDISDITVWNLCLNATERESATALLQESGVLTTFLAASIGTKLPANDWGDEKWGKLLELISTARPELGLILIGSHDEFERSENIRRFWHGASGNLCGKCGPRVSTAILERAVLFVGHDSGPMHLAAAVGDPVVAVFSWHNPPGQWFPGCTKWDHIKIFYPPLPNGIWTSDMRMRRSPTEGILLIKYQEVAHACLALLNHSAI